MDLPDSLYIELSQPTPVSNNSLKIRGLMKANMRLLELSPGKKSPKHDPESYEFWYFEAKKYIRQGLYIKSYNILNRYLDKKLPFLTEIQRIKGTKLMITSILNIVMKTYLSRSENLRFPMLFQLMTKNDNYLKLYYKNLMILINSNEGTRKLLEKSASTKNMDRKNVKHIWKISEEILEKNSEENNSEIDEPIQKVPLIQNINLDSAESPIMNQRKNKEFSVLKSKSVMFFLDEFFILFFKHIICFGMIEKRNNEHQIAAKILLQGYEISETFKNSSNTDILTCCIKIRILLGNFHAEIFNYKVAAFYYEQAMSLASICTNIYSHRSKSKSKMNFTYHYKLELCLSHLIVLLQNMAFLYELQDNFPKCYESMKFSFWITLGFFDPEDELYKFISEQYQTFSERYCNYLHVLGDIDRVFNVFFQNFSMIPKIKAVTPIDNSEIIANQTQAFNEQMYYKYNYDKLNQSLFIPVKSNILNPNYSQSTNLSSRIFSGKPKTTFITDQSSMVAPNINVMKNISESLKPINLNTNDNLTTSMVGSPINEFGSFGGFPVGTKSFVHDDEIKEKDNIARKRKRVMSAKYDRKGYLKIKDKSSYDDDSCLPGLIDNTYKPKQLTTDKYFKTPIYRVKTFQEILNEQNITSMPDIEKIDKSAFSHGSSTIIKKPALIKEESQKHPITIRPKSSIKSNLTKASNNQAILGMKTLDLDEFFSKFIDEKLSQKNQTKPMEIILDEFAEIMKDEEFDHKEFDFSKKMLRLKRKYPLPRYNDNNEEGKEGLNRIKEHTEMTNQAININIESGVSNYLQHQKEVQKELEKEQLAQNIYQSTIILQNNTEPEKPLKNSQIFEGKNKLQTILFKKQQQFHLKNSIAEFKRPTNEKLESFSKLDVLENPKKQQEKMAQHHRTIFLNMVDSYERELEIIDKNLVKGSKTTTNRIPTQSSSDDKSYINTKSKSFMKSDRMKYVKTNLDLANSTNLLSIKAQALKQKNVGFNDLINMKLGKSPTGLKLKEKRSKEKSPTNRAKSRYQINFEYAKVVESSLI